MRKKSFPRARQSFTKASLALKSSTFLIAITSYPRIISILWFLPVIINIYTSRENSELRYHGFQESYNRRFSASCADFKSIACFINTSNGTSISSANRWRNIQETCLSSSQNLLQHKPLANNSIDSFTSLWRQKKKWSILKRENLL